MELIILGYRRGGNEQYENQVLLKAPGDYREASKLIGKKVIYKDGHGNVYKGKIIRVHGRKGVVIAVFKPNLPGQAFGGVAVVEGQ